MNIYHHLYSRSFDPARYPCAIGYENNGQICLTVFLYNQTGKFVGKQVYRPWSTDKKCNDPKTGRYYTWVTEGEDGVFGLNVDNRQGPLYIVEGIFKAAKLHSLGYNAYAVLTSTPKRMKPWFRILKATRRLIGIGDNDPAGEKLVRMVGAGGVSPKDIDEMTSEEVIEFVEKLTNE